MAQLEFSQEGLGVSQLQLTAFGNNIFVVVSSLHETGMCAK
jgi:hypothetical protein